MVSTVDGRIISENWGPREKTKAYSAIYEKCHEGFKSNAWMCGRVTMEANFTKGLKPTPVQPTQPITREPFVADEKAKSFAIAVDAKGKLGWKRNKISGDHIIEVLTTQVSDDYLQYLQNLSISYIFAGEKEINFQLALQQLRNLFPIKTLMLEGGGNINGSLLNAGLIDELSLLIVPIADGRANTATTFDVSEYLPRKKAKLIRLKKVKQMKHDVLWLRYDFKSK